MVDNVAIGGRAHEAALRTPTGISQRIRVCVYVEQLSDLLHFHAASSIACPHQMLLGRHASYVIVECEHRVEHNLWLAIHVRFFYVYIQGTTVLFVRANFNVLFLLDKS
jgi:hypothetical protein